jgi:hypothetical protein
MCVTRRLQNYGVDHVMVEVKKHKKQVGLVRREQRDAAVRLTRYTHPPSPFASQFMQLMISLGLPTVPSFNCYAK